MSETFKPQVDYPKLPLRHPLREKRELLMVSQRYHEYSSALAGIRFLRAAMPYVVLLFGAFIAWHGTVEPHDMNVVLVLTAMWVLADVAVRHTDWRAKSVQAELEGLDREIEAETGRLATASGGGQ